jgi:hypothetical protein
MANIQKYSEWTDEAASSDLAQYEATSGLLPRFKPPEGRTDVRALPPVHGLSSPMRFVWEHYIEVPGKERKLYLVCPKMQAKQDKLPGRFCPACAHLDDIKLNARSAKAITEAEENFRPRRQTYMSVVIRGRESEGAKVWGFAKTIFDLLIEMRLGNGGTDYTHPISGYDIRIKRTGTNKQTKYTIFRAGDGPLLADATALDDLLEAAPNLNTLARVLPHDAVVEAWGEAFGEDVLEEAPQRRTTVVQSTPPRLATSAPKRRTAADDADDDFG